MIRHTNGFLEEYYQQIMTGEILAGYELKDELARLIADMDDDRYIYDTRDADLRMDFMENCVKLTKSPFYGQPMKLMLWQKALISTMYSFKMLDGTDRFRRILLLIARKNTKSETCSGLALTEMITGADGADIVCSSNDDNQANILYTAIDTMRLMIDPKQKDTWKNQQWIKCKINGSKVFKLSDRTRNKEGRNIDFAIVDEVHEMKDNTIIKSIEQSQSLKPNPKLILITTEGFVNDGFLDEELRTARKILSGEDDSISAERYLPWLYTQDSEQEVWQDERSWQKSNPTLGIVKRYDYLREQVDAARRSKADRMFTLSKDFNFKVSNSEAWIMGELLEYSRVYDLDSFHGSIALGGVDLAETTDMCSAKILLLKPDDRTKYIHSMYWIPESKLKNSDDTEAGAHYEEWARQGLIRIHEGNEVESLCHVKWAQVVCHSQSLFLLLSADPSIACAGCRRNGRDGAFLLHDYSSSPQIDLVIWLVTSSPSSSMSRMYWRLRSCTAWKRAASFRWRSIGSRGTSMSATVWRFSMAMATLCPVLTACRTELVCGRLRNMDRYCMSSSASGFLRSTMPKEVIMMPS